MKGELLVVDWVDEGGKKGPPVKVKCDENGTVPMRALQHLLAVFWVGMHTKSSRSVSC